MFVIKCNLGYVVDCGGVHFTPERLSATTFNSYADALNTIDGIRPAAEYGDFLIYSAIDGKLI